MTPFSRLFCAVATVVLLTPICASASIAPGRDVRAASIVPYTSWFDFKMSNNRNTVALPDSGFLVLRYEDPTTFRLERRGRLLNLLWSVPVVFDEGEAYPGIENIGHQVRLITAKTLGDGTRQYISRRIDPATGATIDRTVFAEFAPDLQNDIRSYFSSDSSHQAFIAVGKVRTESGPDDEDIDILPVRAFVLDAEMHLVQERRFELINSTIREKDRYVRASVSDRGDLDIAYIRRDAEGYSAVLRHFVVAPDSAAVAFEERLPVSPHLGPRQFFMSRTSRNSIVVMATMSRDKGDKKVCSFVRLLWHPETARHEASLLEITDEVAERISGEDELEDYVIRQMWTEDNGEVLLVLSKFTSNSWSGYRESIFVYEHGPICVIRIGSDGSLAMSAHIDRNEKWHKWETSWFEGAESIHRNGNELLVATRDRDREGIVVHRIDVSTGAIVPPKTIVSMDESDYLATYLTTWLPNGEVIFFAKEGEEGNAWNLVRVEL